MRRWSATLVFFCLCAGLGAVGRAAALYDATNLVGLPTVAPPVQYSFTESTAQALAVTVTDLQQPAAFQSLQVAVTLGDALVGSPATVDPTTGTATVSLPAATGVYTVQIVGTPAASQGYGNFGVCVALATSATDCIAADSFSGSIVTPATVSTTASSDLNTSFTSTVAGTYTVTITDDAFPAALQMISGGISSGSNPLTSLAPGPTQVTLAAKTNYTLVVGALASSATSAGLYGIQILDPTGAAVFSRSVPVGTLQAATSINNPASQSVTLTATDFGYPVSLAGLGVAITQGSVDLGQLTSAGSVANITLPAGSIQIWQYAAASAPQPGVYSIMLAGSGTSLYSTVQVAGGGTSAQSFAFVATLPAAGTYNLNVTDYQFPAAFQSINSTVAQNGTALTVSDGNFTGTAGVAIVVVDAVPPSSGLGIFDVTLQGTGASPTVLLDQTQAVGGVISTHDIVVSAAGTYDAVLTDLAFPAAFADLAAVVSQGGTVVGKIYGGGTFPFPATAGTYQLTTVSTPGSTNYGLYSLNVTAAVPTVSFSASASTVTTGGSVTLTWSSTNSSACTASGGSGWTGTQATSGTLSLAVSATETLTLTCTGAGGSASQTVSITATAAPHSGGGGGVDGALIGGLGLLVALRSMRQRRRPRARKVALRRRRNVPRAQALHTQESGQSAQQ